MRGSALMNIICLDTEFTGLSKDNEILQLAILDGNGNTVINELYRPEKAKSWPFSQKVHNISPQMVKDKPSFVSERSRLQRYFDDADLNLIEKNCKSILSDESNSNISSIQNDIIDREHYLWANVLKYISYNKSLFSRIAFTLVKALSGKPTLFLGFKYLYPTK